MKHFENQTSSSEADTTIVLVTFFVCLFVRVVALCLSQDKNQSS